MKGLFGKRIRRIFRRWFGGYLQPYCDRVGRWLRDVAPHDRVNQAALERFVERPRANPD
jgi:hypothetical protein